MKKLSPVILKSQPSPVVWVEPGEVIFTDVEPVVNALGYSYTAKFAVKTANVDTLTYTVELTDVLDANNHSVLQDYLAVEGNTMTNVFGEPNNVQRSSNL